MEFRVHATSKVCNDPVERAPIRKIDIETTRSLQGGANDVLTGHTQVLGNGAAGCACKLIGVSNEDHFSRARRVHDSSERVP